MFRSWGLLSWYSGTFRSRETTIELLTPELHDGTLAPSDFDKAVDFLPSKHRRVTKVCHGTAHLPRDQTDIVLIARLSIYYRVRVWQFSFENI
jgi:hypothetical protein